MEHEESYLGRRIIVTTTQTPSGAWTFGAEVEDGGQRAPLADGGQGPYDTEEEARRAAASAAAAAIDRTRTSRGKP